MFHRIKNVKPLDGMRLLVTFRDGEQRVYDAKPLTAKWPSFKALEQPALFLALQVDPGGFGVVWNDGLDLACDELWQHGTPVEEWDPDFVKLTDLEARRVAKADAELVSGVYVDHDDINWN